MANYDYNGQEEKDLVLNPNEYAYVLDRTKGIVTTYVGPVKASLSQTDSPVYFDKESKKFIRCSLDEAVSLFVTAPENWYVILKNPAKDNEKPTSGTANTAAQLIAGKKINIIGPTTFALYPGQMAEVVKGHSLKTSEYLLVKVYDETAARENWDNQIVSKKDTSINVNNNNNEEDDPNNNEATSIITADSELKNVHITLGKQLIIKGTDVNFYIPPTGIQVIKKDDAVTLENLEYAILLDENGSKRYVYGPSVVFPEPTETFIVNKNNANEDGNRKYIFKAIELSETSGVYIKVNTDYEEKGKSYKVGDELFITGKDTMIYYPRVEHNIISYDDNIKYYGSAIPEGEGRYVMDRITGTIKTIKGPSIALLDPRKEVFVKRRLTKQQCELWYPGNKEVLKENGYLYDDYDDYDNSYKASPDSLMRLSSQRVDFDSNNSFNRHTKYVKPRMIDLYKSKYDGAVTVEIFTGYAVNVVSKKGTRKIIAGPQSYIMDYNENLEVMEVSTGKPKTTDNLLKLVYLKINNNKISDIIRVETSDFVRLDVKISYCVDFLKEYEDKWFMVENYVKFLCDRMRSEIKRIVKLYTVQDFYLNAALIIKNAVLKEITISEEAVQTEDGTTVVTDNEVNYKGRLFEENGMFIKDCDILSVNILNPNIASLLNTHQEEIVENNLALAAKLKEAEVERKMKDIDDETDAQQHLFKLKRLERFHDEQVKEHENEEQIRKLDQETSKKLLVAEIKKETLISDMAEIRNKRIKESRSMRIDYIKGLSKVERDKNDSYTNNIVYILNAITPDLVAAIQGLNDRETLMEVTKYMSPLSIVDGVSAGDTVEKLLKGTALETVFKGINRMANGDISNMVAGSSPTANDFLNKEVSKSLDDEDIDVPDSDEDDWE